MSLSEERKERKAKKRQEKKEKFEKERQIREQMSFEEWIEYQEKKKQDKKDAWNAKSEEEKMLCRLNGWRYIDMTPKYRYEKYRQMKYVPTEAMKMKQTGYEYMTVPDCDHSWNFDDGRDPNEPDWYLIHKTTRTIRIYKRKEDFFRRLRKLLQIIEGTENQMELVDNTSSSNEEQKGDGVLHIRLTKKKYLTNKEAAEYIYEINSIGFRGKLSKEDIKEIRNDGSKLRICWPSNCTHSVGEKPGDNDDNVWYPTSSTEISILFRDGDYWRNKSDDYFTLIHPYWLVPLSAARCEYTCCK